jgi:hypothetical protein
MKTRSVIVWLVIAVLLGLATLWLVRSGGAGRGPAAVAQGQTVLPFSMTGASRIVVAQSDGWTDELTRSETDGSWRLRVGRPAQAIDPEAVGWPIAPARISGLSRSLNELRAAAPAGRDAALGEKPTVVTIDLPAAPAAPGTSGSAAGAAGPTTATIRLAERTIGGTGLIEVEHAGKTVRAVVDSVVHDVFRSPGPRGWRDAAVFQGAAARSSRVQLSNPTQALALGKVEGRWRLGKPVSAPADGEAVQRLLAVLDGVQVADFLDSGGGTASTGLEKPSGRITLEADTRGVDGATSRQSDELVLGSPGDASGTRVFASLNASWLLMVDGRTLASLSMDPATYVWHAPTSSTGPDIGEVQLTKTGGGGTTFKRTLERWSQVKPDNTEMLLAEGDLKAVDAMVAFLTGADRSASPASGSSPAGSMEVTFTPKEGSEPAGTIRLRSMGGADLETIDVSRVPPNSVSFKTGEVWRTVTMDRVPKLIVDLWAGPAPTKPAVGPDGKPVEINK